MGENIYLWLKLNKKFESSPKYRVDINKMTECIVTLLSALFNFNWYIKTKSVSEFEVIFPLKNLQKKED